MPYGIVAKRIKDMIESGEIDPDAEAFNRMLDSLGFCSPQTRGRVRVDLRRRKVETTA